MKCFSGMDDGVYATARRHRFLYPSGCTPCANNRPRCGKTADRWGKGCSPRSMKKVFHDRNGVAVNDG